MQYRTPHDAARQKLRASMLAERFPLPVAYLLIELLPVNAIIWIALPPEYRALLIQSLLRFDETHAIASEGTVAYGHLTLVTPDLDEPERRARYLHSTKRCAKNRRDLVAALNRTEHRAAQTVDKAVALLTQTGNVVTPETPVYTGFQFMRVALAVKARDDFDVFPMLSALLNSVGLDDDTIQGATIDAKAFVYGAQTAMIPPDDPLRRVMTASPTIH